MYYQTFFSVFIILTFGNIVNCKLLELNQIRTIAQTNDNPHFMATLRQILKPRIVGTQNHEEVKEFILRELNDLGFHTEADEFNDKPPTFTNLKFTNIIARLNPDADKYLTLACHYDSKYYREHYFVAATDSAVPCAILLNTAKTLLPMLKANKDRTNLSLMLVFFDGEEAFRKWTDSDSLYGSRHLATRWSTETYNRSDCNVVREIDRIDTMVLLDLIGAAQPKFYNYYQNTYSQHKRLYEIERSLKSTKILGSSYHSMFMNRMANGNVQDDQIPFVKRSVPVLHLIPSPFPKVWHTPEDNESNLSMHTIQNFNKLFRVFVYEYLNSPEHVTSLPNKC